MPTRMQGRTTFSRVGALEIHEADQEGGGVKGGLGAQPRSGPSGRAGKVEEEKRGVGRAVSGEEVPGRYEGEGQETLPVQGKKEKEKEEEEPRQKLEERGEQGIQREGRKDTKKKEDRRRKDCGTEGPDTGRRGDRLGSQQSGAAQSDALRQAQNQEEGIKLINEWEQLRQSGLPELGRGRGYAAGHQQDSGLPPFWSGHPIVDGSVQDAGGGGGARGQLGEGGFVSTSYHPEIHQGGHSAQGQWWCPARGYDSRNDPRPDVDGTYERGSRYGHATVEGDRTGESRRILEYYGAIGVDREHDPSNLHERRTCSGGEGNQVRSAVQGSGILLQGERVSPRRKGKEGQRRRKREEQERRRRRQRQPRKERQVMVGENTEALGVEAGQRRRSAKRAEDRARCGKKARLTGDAGYKKSPDWGGGSHGLPMAICHGPEGAATPLGADVVQAETELSPEKIAGLRFSDNGGFSEMVRWLMPRLDSFFFERCRAKPTGRVFPLPTSNLVLRAAFPTETPALVEVLVLLTVSLNSVNGEGNFGSDRISPFQKKILFHLLGHCKRVMSWEISQSPAAWESFFQTKSIDYKGEEVLTAQPIQWENISPALPNEVGSVELSQVVEEGCLHYVQNFSAYLVPEEDQVYTKPPKVHVPPECWPGMCE